MSDDFDRGYFCAVAALLQHSGCVTTEVKTLFANGSNPQLADKIDRDLFVEHGLLPPAQREGDERE